MIGVGTMPCPPLPFNKKIKCCCVTGIYTPALGVSVKSVHLVAGRLGFYSQSGHTKNFTNSIRSFRARRSAQAEVRRVLCMCCSSCYVP